MNQIAELLGCSTNGVRWSLQRHSIELRVDRRGGPAEPDDPVWLRRRDTDDKMDAREIADELGWPRQAILRALNIAQIPLRRGASGLRRFATLDDAAWLRARCMDEALTVRQIAVLAGTNRESVHQRTD